MKREGLSRRDLFKSVTIGTLLIPVGYVAGVTFGGYRVYDGLKYLSDKEATILESLTEVIIPAENEIGVSPQEINMIKKLDQFISVMPPHSRSRLNILLWMVEHAFPIRMPYFEKFTRLSLEHRRKVLERFDENKGVAGRAMVRALKALIQNVYYNDPLVVAKIQTLRACDS
jgi:hypothetical protein